MPLQLISLQLTRNEGPRIISHTPTCAVTPHKCCDFVVSIHMCPICRFVFGCLCHNKGIENCVFNKKGIENYLQ